MIFKLYQLCISTLQKGALFVLCCAVFSVQADNTDEDGASFELASAYISENNVKRLSIAQGDEYYLLSPTVSLLKDFGTSTTSLVYEADYARFNRLSSLNYNNHSVNGKLTFEHTQRLSTDFTVVYEKGVEVFTGANSLAGDFTEFTSLESKRGVASATYGNEDSQGQILVRLDNGSQKYSGNEQAFRSVDSVGSSLQFFYRIAPNTRLLTELSLIDFNYTEASANGDQSNLQGALLVGMEWRANELLYSLVKVGYQEKQFNNASLNDISGLSYLINVLWSPFEQTQIDVSGSRSVIESTIPDIAAFVYNSTSLQLKHSFSEKFHLSMAYSHSKNTFYSGRDNNQDVIIGIDFQFNELSNITLEYKMQDKESTLSTLSYKVNILNIAYKLTLD